MIWGGEGLIFSASEDRTIKVWKENGSWIRDLKGHAHWVNTLALHTDYVLKTGDFERGEKKDMKLRYAQLKGKGHERLVSGSDDFTLIMWEPKKNAKA